MKSFFFFRSSYLVNVFIFSLYNLTMNNCKGQKKAHSVFLALLSSLQYIQVKERERQKDNFHNAPHSKPANMIQCQAHMWL